MPTSRWELVKFVNTQIDFFPETNGSPGESYSVLRETFKAFMRGHIISYSASHSKRKFKHI